VNRNDSADSLIKLFSLNLADDFGEEEEEHISDLEAYLKNIESEELQTELPRRIFNASRVVAERISKLDKDEFGDYVYREDGNIQFFILLDPKDLKSIRLKKASEVLKFWLDRLKKQSQIHKLFKGLNQKEIETCDQEIQVYIENQLLPPKDKVKNHKKSTIQL